MSLIGVGGPKLSTYFYGPLTDAYATKGTAALGLADTRQAWTLVENDATARLSVISGKLTNAASAAALRAGYVVANQIKSLRARRFEELALPGLR